MLKLEVLNEAERVMGICNACRYCEGFCAVFPAVERRRTFSEKDLTYLANLCHNCRGCYYACQYAPPHEFNLNVPKVLEEPRVETYWRYMWPGFLADLFRQNGLVGAVTTSISVLFVVLLLFVIQDPTTVFSPHIGEGAFYKVIPYKIMVLPILIVGLWNIVALSIGFISFWRDTGGTLSDLVNTRAHRCAIRDSLSLRYLQSDGIGCNYPDERFSRARLWFHHLVFYGFMLNLASTTVAAFYHNFLHQAAPYPLWSWPVLLGTVGGAGLLLGAAGLFWFKWQSDPDPANSDFRGMDLMFSLLLFLTSLTGLLLLAFRETSAMGTLLAVHLGVVAGLFLTMPYSKFVHAVYRYAALLRNSIEQLHDE